MIGTLGTITPGAARRAPAPVERRAGFGALAAGWGQGRSHRASAAVGDSHRIPARSSYTISRLCAALLPILAAAFLAAPAHAELIAFAFSGTISHVNDPDGLLSGLVVEGDPFNAVYTFNASAADSYPSDLDFGSYASANATASGRIGGLAYSASGTVVGVTNRSWGDGYTVGVPGAFYAGSLHLGEWAVVLRDSTGSVFVDDTLPLEPPELGRFDLRWFSCQAFQTGARTGTVGGVVTSLTVVPEPLSVCFFIAGIIAMQCERRR